MSSHVPSPGADPVGWALVTAFGQWGYRAGLDGRMTVVVEMPDGSHVRGDVRGLRESAGRSVPAMLPSLAAEYVETFVDGLERTAAPPLPTEGLRVRLHTGDTLSPERREGLVARPLAAGLWETVVIDRPDSITSLERSALGGMDDREIFGAALSNSLAREPCESASYDLDGVPVTYITGGHLYVGAHLHALRLYFPPERTPHGTLVACPLPQLILVHPIGRTYVAHAMRTMQNLAARHAETGDRPLSAQLFWWRPGSYERLDEQRALYGGGRPDLRAVRATVNHWTGNVDLYADEDFHQMVRRVAGTA